MGQVKKNYAIENKLVADIRYVNQKISIMEEITLETICFETIGEVGNKKGCKMKQQGARVNSFEAELQMRVLKTLLTSFVEI